MSRLLQILIVFLCVIACKNKANNTEDKNISNTESKKPNIIIILVDDAGYVDFGFMGSKDLDTPRIDSLAYSGIYFTDAHVTSTVCAPSRAGLLTGQYQQRFGFEANGTGDQDSGDIGLADHVVTIADVFQKNNYETIAIGKWHLGASQSDHPNQRGFDEFYGFVGGSRSYFPLLNPSEEHMLQHNGKKVNFDGYLTDVLGDKSVEYIEKNQDSPFFMYLAYNAVHTPMEAKTSDLEKYKNHPRQNLAAMTWTLDENIGKLIDKLKARNLFDNTLIYFLSDNGGAHNNQSDGGPLKGWKGNAFEGGHRVPFIVSWPKELKGGEQYGGLTSALDIAQTSIAAANITENNLKLDGRNLLPYLKGEKSSQPHQTLYWRKLDDAVARFNNYKVIRLKDYDAVMYDLNKDIGEINDIKKIKKDTFNLMLNNLKSWESEMIKPLWVEGDTWEDITYYIHKQLMQNEKVQYKSPSQKKNFLNKTTP
jgi:arylsulfatase A-like enzyme